MLALLDALKKNVRDFAAREEKFESDFRVATAAELRDFAARNETQETAAHEQEFHATNAFKAEQEECQALSDRRRASINRAHANLSRRLHQEINDQDNQWKEHTQQGVYDAERR